MCSGTKRAGHEWGVVPKSYVVKKRNPLQLGNAAAHSAIFHHSVRRRYTDFKKVVLQSARSEIVHPEKGSPFTLNQHSELRLPEFPGVATKVYDFKKFWAIEKGDPGLQLRGASLGIAQFVVVHEMDLRLKHGVAKFILETNHHGSIWKHFSGSQSPDERSFGVST